MSLITEYYPIRSGFLSESSNGRYKILAQEADKINQNKRMYPRKILAREVKRLKEVASNRTFMGELDHTLSEQISLERVSHLITDIWMDGKKVFLEFELLNTPKGLIAKELIKSGVSIGISSRGTGTLLPGKELGESIVGEDYKAVTWDLVADPSVKKARLDLNGSTVAESLNEAINGYLTEQSMFELLFLDEIKKRLH